MKRPAISIFCLFIVSFPLSVTAKTSVHQRSEAFFQVLKRSSFDDSITSGTTLDVFYNKKGYALALYINVDPDTQHQNNAIVIIKDKRYYLDYEAEDSADCYVSKERLRCRGYIDRRDSSNVPLADIIAGKSILLGGQIAGAYRGGKLLYPEK